MTKTEAAKLKELGKALLRLFESGSNSFEYSLKECKVQCSHDPLVCYLLSFSAGYLGQIKLPFIDVYELICAVAEELYLKKYGDANSAENCGGLRKWQTLD